MFSLKNKKVLITGGTGSLGKSLVNRILTKQGFPIVYSRDEGKQALLCNENITKIIGDVRDYEKLNFSISKYKPDAVIHAAALKRIDDMELYPDECIKTNITGSENVAKACMNNRVSKCILVSTDKACSPINVYGSSKFIAERIFTNYDYHSDKTIFASVRYGNVIASRGSFIPLWLDLLSQNKPINVTASDMTRFLFTLEDAVTTVLSSLNNAEGGEVFIPKIHSYNMQVILNAIEKIHNKKFQYNVTGLRPGEKYHEDMLCETELPFTYEVDNLLCIRPQYTHRQYSNKKKYTGYHFNSSLCLNNNVDDLVDLINRGIQETRL